MIEIMYVMVSSSKWAWVWTDSCDGVLTLTDRIDKQAQVHLHYDIVRKDMN